MRKCCECEPILSNTLACEHILGLVEDGGYGYSMLKSLSHIQHLSNVLQVLKVLAIGI